MCVPSENHELDQTLTVRKLPDLVQASRFELPQANSKCPKNSRVLQQIGLLQDNQSTPLLLLWIWLCISGILCWEKSKDSRPWVSSLENWRRRRNFLVWSWGSQSLSILGGWGPQQKKNKKHEEEAAAGLEKKHNEPQRQICRGRNAEWGRGWQKGVSEQDPEYLDNSPHPN